MLFSWQFRLYSDRRLISKFWSWGDKDLQLKLSHPLRVVVVLLIAFGCLLSFSEPLLAHTATEAPYQERAVHSPDGIGKFYMGREIAKEMGHTGAGWLERPSRETQEQPQRIISALDLKPADIIADIGAGTGYLSFRISHLVPQGKVLAVDVQPEMLDRINSVKQARNITNVKPVLGTVTDPNLPAASIDLAVMVDAYHEFSHPKEMMTAVVKALKPKGRVVLVEYRRENPFVLIKPLHKMTQRQVRQEMQAVGLDWCETKTVLPQQHLMIFQKQS